jgi:SAM-dependent methyltransferase
MPRTGPFDEHFNAYEKWFSRNPYVYRSELEAVAHFIPADGKGLEIGVGSGKFAEPLGIHVGVEPSREMRRLARSRGITVFNAVAEKLPFPQGCFDFALMVTTICFVDDIEKSFREARRVLSNHGSFIIGFVDRDSPLGRIYQQRKEENLFYREATFYGCTEVISLLQRSGFQPPSVIQTVFGRLEEINRVQDFRTGHGEGGFVVIRAARGSGDEDPLTEGP